MVFSTIIYPENLEMYAASLLPSASHDCLRWEVGGGGRASVTGPGYVSDGVAWLGGRVDWLAGLNLRVLYIASR